MINSLRHTVLEYIYFHLSFFVSIAKTACRKGKKSVENEERRKVKNRMNYPGHNGI